MRYMYKLKEIVLLDADMFDRLRIIEPTYGIVYLLCEKRTANCVAVLLSASTTCSDVFVNVVDEC